MAILPTYTTFRWYFAEKKTASVTATFADANPDTISRAAGSFVTDGFKNGMHALPSGTASNEGARYKITTAAATLLTLDSGEVVTAEAGVACTLTGVWLANDGLEEWPGPFAAEASRSSNLVRAGGFTGGITGLPSWFTSGTAMVLTVNAQAADAAKDTDEYDWYLSQRTDDTSKQFLTITKKASTYSQSFSGTVEIVDTGLARSELSYSSGAAVSPEVLRSLFTHVDLYVRRRSDGAIQWLPLYRRLLGATV